jgi:SAM-dependent methyltransferase
MHEAAMSKGLLGFDDNGEVFDRDTLVYRKISDGYKPRVSELHRLYRENALVSKGIVETTLREDGDLEHRRLVISYPFEWPANMYKDAVLFHLGLFAQLDEAGLTLKDALPNNVLFEHTSPVFVDFLSLVPRDRLKEAAWLDAGGYADARFAVVEKMLLPYLLLPLLFFARCDFRTARELLSTRSCNCDGAPPSWRELLRPPAGRGLWRRYLRALSAGAAIVPARQGGSAKSPAHFRALIDRLVRVVADLDVTPPRSGYSFYYDEKREALSLADTAAFLPKQKTVHDILRARAPGSVLDIGANTGWYSVLAAGLGASVIALEDDESCIDILYARAKRERLRILPLKGSFAGLTTEIHGAKALERDYAERGVGRNALYRAGVDRLAADLVLVLGLFHHLVLGEGRPIEGVLEILARLTRRTLVLEFIALDDEKVVGEPGFFANLRKFDAGSYNLERVLQAGRRHFPRVEVLASHPASRTIVAFDR